MSVSIEQGQLRQSNGIEKLVTKKLFWILFTFVMFAYPLWKSVNRDLPPPLPVFYDVPDYVLTNEMGKSFGSKDLNGKIYIANFAFTSCPSVCPELMGKLQKVQKRVRGLGQAVALVTYTVDPDTDTPEVLFKHARKYEANPFVWTFLTGTQQQLNDVIVGGFKLAKGERKQDQGLFDIAHSDRLVLVDREGKVRGYYPTDENSINKLMIDVGLLVNNSFSKI